MATAVQQPANRRGAIADFVTGYLQKAEILHSCEVQGGIDVHFGVTTPAGAAAVTTGYAVGRLAVVTRLADGTFRLSLPTAGAGAVGQYVADPTLVIGDANCIIAQSDDSLRNIPEDAIPAERLSTRARNILFNTAVGEAPAARTGTMKSIAIYRITNPDDIKIIPVAPTAVSVTR